MPAQDRAWPLGFRVSVALLAVVAVHAIAYADGGGSEPGPSAFHATNHAAWTLLVSAVLIAVAISAVGIRTRASFAAERQPGRGEIVTAAARTWLTLFVSALLGFVVLENVESAVSDGSLVGIDPILMLDSVAFGVVLLALLALTLMTVGLAYLGRGRYETVLNRSYAGLVSGGVYTARFHQPDWAIAFVTGIVSATLDDIRSPGTARILEVGCGTGVWLSAVASALAQRGDSISLAGFDLSPDMIGEARRRLESDGIESEVRTGDLFDSNAYAFGGSDRHDLLFAYDVVQQLPSDVQAAGVDAMLSHVSPGGALVVFDHDRSSRFGRVMGAKKWLRRYFNVPLVPRFYIHARYPKLEAIRRSLAASGHEATIFLEPEGRKRALVVRTSAAPDR